MKFFPDDFSSCVPLEKGGSGRKFYRVGLPNGEVGILCCYDNSREENALYASLADFLARIGFPVPRILASEQKSDGTGTLLMEDAGDVDLWNMRNDAWSTRKIAYQSALRALHQLHRHGFAACLSGEVKLMPGFDSTLYEWERNYFLENAAGRYLSIVLSAHETAILQKELIDLAGRLQTLPPQLVHRDCQSQNILWKNDQVCFIDFQGMRVGTGFYDLGSLLWDPYVRFVQEERSELLDFYWNLGVPGMARQKFAVAFLDAAAQRLMQALGAYGFLGIVKGRKDFLAHFPVALENLFMATRDNPALPCLHRLVGMMRAKMQSLS